MRPEDLELEEQRRRSRREAAAQELAVLLGLVEPTDEDTGASEEVEEDDETVAEKPRVGTADAGARGLPPEVKKSAGELLLDLLVESGAFDNRDDRVRYL